MRSSTGLVLTALGSVLLISGCTNADEACANAFETTALTVERVATASFSCSSDFGHPDQGGVVSLSVNTEEEALSVIDDVYRAFAASSDLEDAWKANPSFYLDGADRNDPENLLDDSELGIRDDPQIYNLRDHYGINPSGAE